MVNNSRWSNLYWLAVVLVFIISFLPISVEMLLPCSSLVLICIYISNEPQVSYKRIIRTRHLTPLKRRHATKNP